MKTGGEIIPVGFFWNCVRERRPLEDKHGVSFNTMKKIAKREDWTQMRNDYRLGAGLAAVIRAREKREQDLKATHRPQRPHARRR